MPKKLLQVIDGPYRCNSEEQDDPAVWITRAMKAAGADIDVLLRGSAVNYAVKSQDASGLVIGSKEQKHPANLVRDLEKLMEGGSTVYQVQDDASDRGIQRSEVMGGIESISRQQVAKLLGQYDLIWHW